MSMRNNRCTIITMLKNNLRYLLTMLVLVTLSACAQHKPVVHDTISLHQDSIRQWWCYPLPGAKVISPYGIRKGRRHSGTDLKTINRDKILAAFDGEVVFSGSYHGYGLLIRIKHDNGLETDDSHNSKNMVKVGEWVRAGHVIALTGQTGRASTPHLHFETRIGGQAVNSAIYFDHQNHTIRLGAFTKKKDGYVIRRK